jgi:hypothetical protein
MSAIQRNTVSSWASACMIVKVFTTYVRHLFSGQHLGGTQFAAARATDAAMCQLGCAMRCRQVCIQLNGTKIVHQERLTLNTFIL